MKGDIIKSWESGIRTQDREAKEEKPLPVPGCQVQVDKAESRERRARSEESGNRSQESGFRKQEAGVGSQGLRKRIVPPPASLEERPDWKGVKGAFRLRPHLRSGLRP